MRNEHTGCGVHLPDLELLLKFSDTLRRKIRLNWSAPDVERFADGRNVFDHLPFGGLAVTILKILDELFSLRFDLLDVSPDICSIMGRLIVVRARLVVSLLRFRFFQDIDELFPKYVIPAFRLLKLL